MQIIIKRLQSHIEYWTIQLEKAYELIQCNDIGKSKVINMKLGELTFSRKKADFDISVKYKTISKNDLSDGVNMFDEFIVWNEKEVIKVYDRECDHNGGRLISQKGKTSCPLHGWEFCPETGTYLNAKCSKIPLFEGRVSGKSNFEVPLRSFRRKLEKYETDVDISIRFLNHACLIIECSGLKFATDPWIFGSAFCNGWWLANASPSDSISELNSCDFIYISHNHPDHLHPETLSQIRKDMPIVTACFTSGSSQSMLADLKFETIHTLKFDEKWFSQANEIAFSVLKSGDFRDDSGLLIEAGNKTIILNVDANFLDFWRFPDKIDMLASTFAGNASGFPLCFENIEFENKRRVIQRNKKSIYTTNKMMLQKAKPKIFLPYAGFFKENAKRDSFIKENNLKNNIDDYADLCGKLNIQLVNVVKTPSISLNNAGISSRPKHTTSLKSEVPEIRIKHDECENQLTRDLIVNYFANCNFYSDLDLLLLPTDENFENANDSCYVKFTRKGVTKVFFEKQVERRTDVNFLQIKVRKYELAKVIRRGLPWEDLLIGFQCRIYREPNLYNVDFWHHFTNVYVSENVRRRTHNCNGCELINQQI